MSAPISATEEAISGAIDWLQEQGRWCESLHQLTSKNPFGCDCPSGRALRIGALKIALKRVTEMQETLDTYNGKLRELRAKFGIDLMAGDVDRLYEAHEKSETDLGILRLKGRS